MPVHTAADDELTPAEAAATLGVSVRTLARLKADGRIGFVTVGRRTYYRRSDLAGYLRELRRMRPSAEAV